MRRLLVCILISLGATAAAYAQAPPATAATVGPVDDGSASCANTTGARQLYWGDLHVHTARSLDAYAFGALATPAEAYAFARGQPLRLANGEQVSLERPLDFVAVTDHAETLDVMYLCTDPVYADDAYCRSIRDLRARRESRRLFVEYLLPVVATTPATKPAVCERADCQAARDGQWRRTRFDANQANEPCAFTAFIGYEWSPSPAGRHWHRNVIFSNDQVPDQVVSYVSQPEVHQLWDALERTCLDREGCDVLAIPHNINYSEGRYFEVEDENAHRLAQRARLERLVEMFQEKGGSECLAPLAGDEACGFERIIPSFAAADVGRGGSAAEAALERLNAGYYRTLLGRGLTTFQRTGTNPLRLGAIGSTDTHFGTAGAVAEEGFTGGVWGLWATDRERLADVQYNPGGLVAVWAEANTREAIFAALKRREAYATSGPRISLRFGVAAGEPCAAADVDMTIPMGGQLPTGTEPTFTVLAGRDRVPLGAIEIIKGTVGAEGLREQVHAVARFDEGRDSACVTWRDPDFDPAAPSYWYARVLEQPSPRWSRQLCTELDACGEFPAADQLIRERAWSSPIWHLPGASPAPRAGDNQSH